MCSVCSLTHRWFTLKFQSTRRWYLAFPNPYLRECLFLALLYVMGHATVMSIQLDPTHPSLNIVFPICVHTISFSPIVSQLPISIHATVRWISKYCISKKSPNTNMSQQWHTIYPPSHTWNWYLRTLYVPNTYTACLSTIIRLATVVQWMVGRQFYHDVWHHDCDRWQWCMGNSCTIGSRTSAWMAVQSRWTAAAVMNGIVITMGSCGGYGGCGCGGGGHSAMGGRSNMDGGAMDPACWLLVPCLPKLICLGYWTVYGLNPVLFRR